MGQELECKLAVSERSLLRRILEDRTIAQLAEPPWRALEMRTTYFDTSEQLLQTLRWTLRLRSENGRGVVCLKTPSPARYTCGEWQTQAAQLDFKAVRNLVRSGAPQALLEYFTQETFLPVCGARFARRCVMLRFPDGSRAELAGDEGILFGKTQQLPFTELELELKDGSAQAMLALAQRLCERYALSEQHESKFMRARQLR